MNQIASDMNKSKRQLMFGPAKVTRIAEIVCRRQVAERCSKLAVTSRPLEKPQHRPRITTQRDGGMVCSEQHVLIMESVRFEFSSMDSWKTFVVTRSSFLETDIFFCSGCGKERLMVR
jgi:hypothetical protein